MKRRIRLGGAAALLCALAMLAGCAAAPFAGTSAAMGSVLTADLYAEEPRANALWTEAVRAVSALDGRISATDPESELSRLNDSGEAALSEETFSFIQDALALCRETGGALDVTLGVATALWGFSGEEPALPSPEALEAAMRTAGYADVRTDPATRTVTLPRGARIDPGAVGKGAAADGILSLLRESDCPAVINFGGTVLLYGRPSGKKTWTAGLRDPFGGPSDWFATVALPAKPDAAYFLSTSGSYEKFFTAEDGTTYHHILDPATGYPVKTDLLGVTVISGGGLLSDALSTACFVTGPTEETLSLLARRGAEAVFVYEDGGVRVTDGLRGAVSLSALPFFFVDEGPA